MPRAHRHYIPRCVWHITPFLLVVSLCLVVFPSEIRSAPIEESKAYQEVRKVAESDPFVCVMFFAATKASGGYRQTLYGTVAAHYWRLNLRDQAFRIYRGVMGHGDAIHFLLYESQQKFNGGKRGEALMLLDIASNIMNDFSIDSPWLSTLIANKLFEYDEIIRAKQLTNKTEGWALSLKHGVHRVETLAFISALYRRMGDMSSADRLADLALYELDALGDDEKLSYGYLPVKIYSYVGKYQEAMKKAAESKDFTHEVSGLEQLARIAKKIGHFKEAAEALSKAVNIIVRTQDESTERILGYQIAGHFIEMQNYEAALGVSKELENSKLRDSVTFDVADDLMGRGKVEEAEKYLSMLPSETKTDSEFLNQWNLSELVSPEKLIEITHKNIHEEIDNKNPNSFIFVGHTLSDLLHSLRENATPDPKVPHILEEALDFMDEMEESDSGELIVQNNLNALSSFLAGSLN